MNEINRVTAVTPSALVAAALLTHGKRGIPHADLVAACERLARILRGREARFAPSLLVEVGAANGGSVLRHGALREACELLSRAGHLETHQPGTPVGERGARPRPGPDAVYVVPDVGRLSLDIAKNLIVHFFVTRAMIATPLIAAPSGLSEPQLSERVQALSRLFKYEFQFRADAKFETIFAETLAAMRADGEVVVEPDHDSAGSVVRLASAEEGPRAAEGRERAVLHFRMVRAFVEGYRVAARGCAALLRGPLAPKDLAKRTMTTGERMFLAGEIACREAVTRPILENALLAFVDQGYLRRNEGKYVLQESYANPDAVRVIEGRVATYLPASDGP
jgi:glycerol-3-phosphate O-acyltransferase